jgi:hypothetical protein
MRFEEILDAVRKTRDCSVLPPIGIPTVGSKYSLPEDVSLFYSACGGALLYEQSEFPALIVPPDHVVPANPIIVGEECEDDISAAWHIIVDDLKGNYLTVDLSPPRLGRCYDSFFDRHAVRGSCPIIARSFSELFERLWRNGGKHWYWLEPDFVPIGDAYD